MVAFELARYFEANGNNADAGRWYLTAAQRFRRADWKTKAQESATRLGATEPAEVPASAPREEQPTEAVIMPAAELEAEAEAQPAVELEEVREAADVPAQATTAAATGTAHGHRRGRGRRGEREQRGRRGSGHQTAARDRHREPETRKEPVAALEPEERPRETHRANREAEPVPSLRGKYGDPGLSSRLTQLEMNFRRLLACSPAKLEEAGKAPAGPGVWVLTDSDLTTYYYVEACQTLRVAIPNILKGTAGKRGDSIAIKPALAENLGIAEARVSKYLSDHCVVRWLQMDEDAAHFAHFLIAVLRPALNQ